MKIPEFIFEDDKNHLVLDHQGSLYQFESTLIQEKVLFPTVSDQEQGFSWFLEYNGNEFASESLEFMSPKIEEKTTKVLGANKFVTVELNVVMDGPGPHWVMKLVNHGPGIITGAGFILKNRLSFGPELSCTFPYCPGWELPLSKLEEGEVFSLDYPVKASMQWVSVYGKQEGVYFGIHDSIPLYKELVIHNQSVLWKFTHMDLHSGEHQVLPAVYLLPHSDGWRGAAKYYQAWVQEHVKTPDAPSWYAQKPSWAWVGLKGQHENIPWHDVAYLPELSTFVAGAGIDLIQLTAYTEQGHDTLYPDYEPGSSIGGEDGLRQAVNAIHKAGRKISIYTNGRVIDPASSVSLQDRQLWGVRATPGAEVFKEQYGEVVFDVMCPGASGWRKLFIEKLEYLAKTFDIDGIYIDQVSGCRSLPCYATHHDHAKPNEAWSFYRKFMEELRERLKSLKADIFLATEGVNDFLGQYFDSQQAHNDWSSLTRERGIPLPDLFHTTFPGQLLNIGCITHEKDGPYYLKMAHLSGGGCDFGVWDWKEMPDNFIKMVKVVIEWYAEYSETFRFGKIVPLDNGSYAQGWKINAFYQPTSIIANGTRLAESKGSLSSPGCSVFVPLPTGSKVSKIRYMQGPNVSPCDCASTSGGLLVHFDSGKGELVGVAIELSYDDES